MKKTIICIALLGSALLVRQEASAQVRFHVNLNIGSQPVWGPVGYDYAEYYYLPDIETYYYVPTRQFIYQSGNRWIYSSALPPRYHDYDLYSGYKVVMNEPRPYLHFNDHRMRYSNYRGNRSQVIIRNSDDRRYWGNPGHPRYDEYRRDHDHGNHGNGNRGDRGDRGNGDRGNGRGNGNGHDRHHHD